MLSNYLMLITYVHAIKLMAIGDAVQMLLAHFTKYNMQNIIF